MRFLQYTQCIYHMQCLMHAECAHKHGWGLHAYMENVGHGLYYRCWIIELEDVGVYIICII